MNSLKRNHGMTLIELMVSMLGLAVIMTGLMGFLTGTLAFTGKTVSTAERMQNLTDTSAYLGDMLRRASSISTTGLTINGEACDISASAPCFAMIVPESTTGGNIDSYLLLAYRLEPRSNLGAAYKVSDTWADSNTSVLREFRSVLCGGSVGTTCTGQPSMPTIATAQAFFVADYLVPSSELSVPVFAYDGFKQITLYLQIKARQKGQISYTPPTPYKVTISKRN